MTEELEQMLSTLREKGKELSEKTSESFKYIPTEPLKPHEKLTPTPLEAMKKAFEEEERVYKEYLKLCEEYYEAMKRQLQ